MGLVADALSDGFACLLDAAGEALTFRGASVTAVVNRNVRAQSLPNAVTFKPFDASEIMLWADALDPVPKAGERFTDSAGLHHRVQAVQRMGLVLTCRCHVSDAS